MSTLDISKGTLQRSLSNKKRNKTKKKALRNCFLEMMMIIIIMSCHQNGYPWPSLATSPYRSSPLAGFQGCIPYPHIAAVCMFELVILLLLGHIWGVHRSTSLMSSSLLLQQCPACLVRLTWIVFVMGGKWPYSWCLVGCCRQDLFNIAHNILV